MDGSLGTKKEEPKDELLKNALADYEQAETAWADNRRLALDDIKFRAGDQWPEEIKTLRTQLGKERPMLVVDKINQYVRQVVNDARQNRPAIKVRPIDDYGDVEVAEAYQGVIRNICQRSNADTAFDNAIECAVVGGFGYYRVTTEYLHSNTFNQEICVKRIGNPLSVLLDPNAMEADASDARYAFIIDEMPKKDFKKKYPNAKFTDFDTDGTKYKDGWTQGENIRYAEYFYKVEEESQSHLLADGTVVTEEDYQIALEELGEAVPPIEETRNIPKTTVKWCRLSGAEVLEDGEWLGKYIPIIRVVGNEYNVEGKVIFSGLIRAAKDPQRLYNYSRSAYAERVALTPKAPWLIAEGQIEGYDDIWEKSNSEPAVLVYKANSIDGTQVPPPMRVNAADIPEGFARDMSLSEHDIQASMGMYSASIGQAGNERSGKAIMARQREGDTATFHYQDNAARGIRYLGVILVDLIPKIYDSRRVLRLLGEDGESTTAEHDPNMEQPFQKMGGHKIFNLGIGTFDVHVDVGPSFTTRRIEQSEAMMELIHNSPEVMQIAGDLLVKSQDWPGAQDLSERFRLMLPPPIQQAIAAKKQGMPPEAIAIVTQAQQAVQERDQQIQEMGQALQEAQTNQAKLEAQLASANSKAAVEKVNSVTESANLQLQVMQKEVDLIKAQNELIESKVGENGEEVEMVMTENGAMPFEQWKVLVQESTKILLKDMDVKRQAKEGEESVEIEPAEPKNDETIAQILQMQSELMRLYSAPRIRIPTRGQNGLIESVTEQIAQ